MEILHFCTKIGIASHQWELIMVINLLNFNYNGWIMIIICLIEQKSLTF